MANQEIQNIALKALDEMKKIDPSFQNGVQEVETPQIASVLMETGLFRSPEPDKYRGYVFIKKSAGKLK